MSAILNVHVPRRRKSRPAERNTRFSRRTDNSHVKGLFSNSLSQSKRCAWMWRRLTNVCCKREPMETALFHGDGAHAVVTRLVWACEHELRTCVAMSVGCEPGLPIGAQTWTRAKVKARPVPLSNRQARDSRKAKLREKKEDKRERESENRERETINKLQTMLLSYLCSRPSNAGHSLLACYVFPVGLRMSFLCGCCGPWELISRLNFVVADRFQSEFVHRHGF